MNNDNPLIIDHQKGMSENRRKTELGLTVAGWLTWLVLARRILVFGLWSFGFQQFYTHMFALGGIYALGAWMRWYSLVLMGNIVLLLCWSTYNRVRFRKADKRRRIADVVLAENAASLSINEAQVRLLQDCQEVTVQFYGNGQLGFQTTTNSETIKGIYDPKNPPMLTAWEKQLSESDPIRVTGPWILPAIWRKPSPPSKKPKESKPA